MPHKQVFLLQVARASYINQILAPPACKFLKFFISKSLTFQISIFQYSICTCSILLSFLLTFYVQTIHFLLPFSKSCFNLVLVLFLHFSFHYSLNKVPSFSDFLICITMKLRSLAF